MSDGSWGSGSRVVARRGRSAPYLPEDWPTGTSGRFPGPRSTTATPPSSLKGRSSCSSACWRLWPSPPL